MSIFKGRLAAREGGYFKQRDEEDLKVWRKRRVAEGAITSEQAGTLNPKVPRVHMVAKP